MYKRVGRRGAEVEWVVAKTKTKKQDDTIVEFREAMISTCNCKRLIFHYKAWIDVCEQYEQYQVPTAKLEPAIGSILPVLDLQSWKKALWRSR